jgi:transcriptional regulator with GAF, ATPase, and Fis domain
MMLKRLGAGERVEHFETVRVTKDGRRVDVLLSVFPIIDSTGRIIGVSKIVRDITEAKRAKEELQRSYAEVKQLKEKLQAESDYLQEQIKVVGSYDEIVGQSEALKQVLMEVEQVARTDSVVLITGETGTGKELIARAIHNRSKRKGRVMVKVDCAALPPTLRAMNPVSSQFDMRLVPSGPVHML